ALRVVLRRPGVPRPAALLAPRRRDPRGDPGRAGPRRHGRPARLLVVQVHEGRPLRAAGRRAGRRRGPPADRRHPGRPALSGSARGPAARERAQTSRVVSDRWLEDERLQEAIAAGVPAWLRNPRTQRLLLGDWHPLLRDPIDVLRLALLIGSA